MAEDGIEVRVVGFEQLVAGSLELAARIEHDAGAALERDTAAKTAQVVRARVPHAGWIEFGGTRGRPYAPIGRYLMPTALAAEPQAVAVASREAQKTIGGFPWPRVSP